jgi:CTP synthase (UTP-ammonia lyase)
VRPTSIWATSARFLSVPCSKKLHGHQRWQDLLSPVIQEGTRRQKYNSGTVQVVPHVTDEIKSTIRSLAGPDVDVVISEVGGTVGDIEGLPFALEAVRQMRHEVGRDNVVFCPSGLHPLHQDLVRSK